MREKRVLFQTGRGEWEHKHGEMKVQAAFVSKELATKLSFISS
jgi:hypothetical protein